MQWHANYTDTNTSHRLTFYDLVLLILSKTKKEGETYNNRSINMLYWLLYHLPK